MLRWPRDEALRKQGSAGRGGPGRLGSGQLKSPCRVVGWLGLGLLLAVAPLLGADDAALLEKRLAAARGAERVELLLQLAEAHLYRAPDKVVRYAQQALDEARSLALASETSRALLDRGVGYFQLDDLDRALASYQESMKVAEGRGDHVVMGGALNGIAAVSMRRGELDAALASFTEAAGHLEKTPNREKLAGVFNNVAIIYYSRGQYAEALDYMLRALALYEEAGDERGQGVVLNSIGNVYNKSSELSKARDYFERALALAEKTSHTQLQVGCLVNLGEIQIKRREWDSALVHLRKALALARELGSPDNVSVCLNNIGDVLREKGELEAALRYYLDSMRIFEEMKSRPRLVVSFINIGRLYSRIGRRSEAESYLQRALATAREVQQRSLEKDALEELVGLFEREGEFQRAFEYQRAFNALEKQIFSKESRDRITSLESRNETEKRQAEIELLKKQGEIQDLEVRRQRLWLLLIALGLVLSGALAFVLYRRYRLKVRTHAELASAYERMAELASLDALTGLYNRRSGMDRLEIELVRSARTGRPFSLLMVDVDDFKQINDRHGHDCGDQVLVRLAALLTASVRALDVVVRWGGEEFLVILPETGRDGAFLVAEKIRRTVASSPLALEGREVAFTVTLGLAAYERLGSVSECLRAADQALYEGKRAGKNRVACAVA